MIVLLLNCRNTLFSFSCLQKKTISVNFHFRENRERRIGIDRVKDSVEKSLQQEHDSIILHQDIMKELVEQVCVNFNPLRYGGGGPFQPTQKQLLRLILLNKHF